MLGGLTPVILTFAVMVLVVAIGASILTTFQTTAGAQAPDHTGGNLSGNAAWNVTGQGLGGVTQISSYFPILGLVVIASVVIGLLIMAFKFRNEGY